MCRENTGHLCGRSLATQTIIKGKLQLLIAKNIFNFPIKQSNNLRLGQS